MAGVLERRGWDTLDAGGTAFTAYLEAQEGALKNIMAELGFVEAGETR